MRQGRAHAGVGGKALPPVGAKRCGGVTIRGKSEEFE